MFESEGPFPLYILTRSPCVTLPFHFSASLAFDLLPPWTETPTCFEHLGLATFQISWIALDLLTYQGLGTCQREQSKPDRLELLTSGPPKSQKQIQKSLVVLSPVFRVAFILTSVLVLIEHSIGDFWSDENFLCPVRYLCKSMPFLEHPVGELPS